MTIYIYGSKSFKNSIQTVLDHANIKFRLEEDDSIQEITSLDELMAAVEDNPKNIFLIDDEKIIKKNSLNDKIKFLKPKDGIEEEFLKEHGIGDMSVDSIEDIPAQIIKKIESIHKENADYGVNSLEYYEDTNNHQSNELSNEEETLFVENTNENSYKEKEKEEIPDDESEEDESEFDMNDILSLLSEHEEEKEEDSIEEQKSSDEENELEIEQSPSIEEDDFGLTVEKIEKKGADDMSDDFSELDSLSEDELMAALNGIDVEPSKKVVSDVSKQESKVSNEVALNSSSVNDIASLITQLLNNKTLEITIKIKE